MQKLSHNQFNDVNCVPSGTEANTPTRAKRCSDGRLARLLPGRNSCLSFARDQLLYLSVTWGAAFKLCLGRIVRLRLFSRWAGISYFGRSTSPGAPSERRVLARIPLSRIGLTDSIGAM